MQIKYADRNQNLSQPKVVLENPTFIPLAIWVKTLILATPKQSIIAITLVWNFCQIFIT